MEITKITENREGSIIMSRKLKISAEGKEYAVESYLKGKLVYNEVCGKYGIDGPVIIKFLCLSSKKH